MELHRAQPRPIGVRGFNAEKYYFLISVPKIPANADRREGCNYTCVIYSELAYAEIGPCVRDDFSYLGFRVLVPPPLADRDSD